MNFENILELKILRLLDFPVLTGFRKRKIAWNLINMMNKSRLQYCQFVFYQTCKVRLIKPR